MKILIIAATIATLTHYGLKAADAAERPKAQAPAKPLVVEGWMKRGWLHRNFRWCSGDVWYPKKARKECAELQTERKENE